MKNNPQSMGLDDMFEQCLDLIERGASIEDCIARFPSQANELRELLLVALELDAISPPLMTRPQMQRMQNDIFARIDAPPSWWGRLMSRQFILAAGGIASIIIIVAGLVFMLNREEPTEETMIAAVSASPETELPSDETDEPVDPITAVAIDLTKEVTEVPTETDVPASETATIEPTASDTNTPVPPPSETATIEPTEAPDEAAALPVYIDFAGQIGEINTENGHVQLAEVSVVFNEQDLATVEVGDYVVVSGLIDDDGLLMVDVTEDTTVVAIEEDRRQCEFDDGEDSDRICHPVLLILAEAFQVSYDELDVLHEDGLGIGEISRLYLLAEEANTDVVEIIELREEGFTWVEIIEQFPVLSSDDLALGIIIGDGHGQTIRPNLDGAKIYMRPTDVPDNSSSGNQTNSNTGNTQTSNTSVPPPVNTVPPPLPPATAEPPPTSAPPEMVTICHNGSTIAVDWDSWVNAHSKHGDTLGACP